MNPQRVKCLFWALICLLLFGCTLIAYARETEKSIEELAASIKVEDLPLGYQCTDEELKILLAA